MNKTIINILVAATAITVASNSDAGDRKVYPGEMAAMTYGEDMVQYLGTIYNPSHTKWLRVQLPVINDDTTSGIDKSYVYVVDQHYTSNVRCSINTAYWNNTTDSLYGFWGAYKSSQGSSGNRQTLSTGAATHGSTRHEFIDCLIPPRYQGKPSFLVSYIVEE